MRWLINAMPKMPTEYRGELKSVSKLSKTLTISTKIEIFRIICAPKNTKKPRPRSQHRGSAELLVPKRVKIKLAKLKV